MSTVAAAAVSAPAIQRVSPSPPPPLPTQQQIVGGNAIAGVVGVPPVAGGGGGFSNSSLYVGDLHPAVNEDELFEIFGQVVPVTSVRVCRDLLKRCSLGYAYVNFNNSQDAVHAMEVLNFYHVRGKPIRIMLSHRDPSIRKSGYANVFIKNLDESIDNKALHDTFGSFGTILSCKVATDSNGRSKGYGFIQYDQEEEAQRAIDHLNGMLLNDKQVYVGLFVRRQERSVKFTNVYVKNLAETITDEEMNNLFGKYGPITSAVVMRDATGKSRGFGFVNFQNPDDAASAVDNLNGSTFDDKVLYVGKAQRKAEREAELKAKFEQERNGRFEKLQGANLYLKNIDDNINDEKLKELFSDFGTITSCKVMLDPHGQSRGSGFVAFSTPEEASRAVNEMNGKMIGRKPLYVAVAQRKEERKARLQAQFAQLRAPGAMTLAIPSNVPGYHPGTPRLGPPQLYYGQGTPGLIPPQPAGYGFQQQLMPGIRPGVGPNFMIPYHLQRQGQPGQRMGVRRGGPPQQMQQQQQLVRNANQGYRYNARNNGVDPAAMLPQGLVSPVMPVPIDVAGIPSVVPVDGNRPSPLTLASALASATPEHQRMILGEQLFPLVERLELDNAGKVTGMLLEMDQTEVLHLVESPDALKKKVAEAMEVLRMASDNASEVDQFGSLSLHD